SWSAQSIRTAPPLRPRPERRPEMKRLLLGLFIALSFAAGAAAPGTHPGGAGATLRPPDPAKTTTPHQDNHVHLVFNGLTRIEHDMTTKPDLAVSWSASDDLKIWTFRLRPGVKFHHGRMLDADDVVATMRRTLDPATGSRARANLSMVEKVEA